MDELTRLTKCSMFKFKGFKATFNISSGRNNFDADLFEPSPGSSINGNYRANRDEFYGNGVVVGPPKTFTPAMVSIPPDQNQTKVKSKSTNDLTVNDVPVELRRSTPEVSMDPRGGTSRVRDSNDYRKSSKEAKERDKTHKKLEKQRLDQQKKREKVLAKEQAKQEKLRKEREKQEAKKHAREAKIQRDKNQKNKSVIPKPNTNPLAQASAPYSMSTLESSISKSSGPPPYVDDPKASGGMPQTLQVPTIPPPPPPPHPIEKTNPEKTPDSKNIAPNPPKAPQNRTNVLENKTANAGFGRMSIVVNRVDSTGNTGFAKRIDDIDSSWNMISEHREQITRKNKIGTGKPKQMVLDLNFNAQPTTRTKDDKDNSDA